VTICDFDGNGLKDIIAADDRNITLFLQKTKLSFKPYCVQTNEKILSLNGFITGEKLKEDIICMGKDKVFYFHWNKGEIEGPRYIKNHDYQLEFLSKQRNIKNYPFIFDLNNDTLDDIIIPTSKDLLIIWQIEPLVFKHYLVKLDNSFTSTNLNMQQWPKIGNKTNEVVPGFSFFPTNYKKIDYWFQDYNNDKLLDIIAINNSPEGPKINVYLQQKNYVFESPHSLQYRDRFNVDSLRFIDLNNDGLLEIVETDIRHPLENNDSLFPLLITKVYYPTGQFNFNKIPEDLYKSALIPGLNNIVDLDNDACYEYVSVSSPLKLGSKESLIKAIANKELKLNIRYLKINKAKGKIIQNIELNKEFSLILPDINNLNNFKQFIRIDDINSDGIKDILVLKKNTVLEINFLEIKNGLVFIKNSLEIILPYPIYEIALLDIDSDGNKEFITIDQTGKTLSVIKN
jgi:hypothetical protein